MGTRGLTMVIHNQKTVIAQYGQWDHYPSGQGLTALKFLKSADLEKFKKTLERVKFIDEEKQKEISDFCKSIGCADGWMNMEQAEKYHARYPLLTRDNGAEILNLVYNDNTDETLWLNDSHEFAGDSLFCEWAYVIDLDKNSFEVYSGFNKKPLDPSERFAYMDGVKDYNPVRLLVMFDINDLPDEDKFVKLDKEEEE